MSQFASTTIRFPSAMFLSFYFFFELWYLKKTWRPCGRTSRHHSSLFLPWSPFMRALAEKLCLPSIVICRSQNCFSDSLLQRLLPSIYAFNLWSLFLSFNLLSLFQIYAIKETSCFLYCYWNKNIEKLFVSFGHLCIGWISRHSTPQFLLFWFMLLEKSRGTSG